MQKHIVSLLVFSLLISGCVQGSEPRSDADVKSTASNDGVPEVTETKESPKELPKGILVDEIPENADVIFGSIRYVLNDMACLNEDYELKDNFINDPDCNGKIYASDGQLASLVQLFTMDIETGHVEQITNTDCFFVNGQVVDSKTIMAIAICSDTDGNGRLNHQDQPQLYMLDMGTENMDCLTCGLDLIAINNPDYSSVNKKILFSSGIEPGMNNHLFTIDSDKNLVQLTNDSEYLDFDCSWSEDGTKIVASRLPNQEFPFSIPSQVWLMDADGTNMEKITDGGKNPEGEENQGPYPIGIDADPDLSPDNHEIVFSRLKTGKQNGFGIFELVIVDVDTKEERILDSKYANMVPEWKSRGILLLRQIGEDFSSPTDVKQALYLYKDGTFEDLEGYPYNVFPLGAYSGSWIE